MEATLRDAFTVVELETGRRETLFLGKGQADARGDDLLSLGTHHDLLEPPPPGECLRPTYFAECLICAAVEYGLVLLPDPERPDQPDIAITAMWRGAYLFVSAGLSAERFCFGVAASDEGCVEGWAHLQGQRAALSWTGAVPDTARAPGPPWCASFATDPKIIFSDDGRLTGLMLSVATSWFRWHEALRSLHGGAGPEPRSIRRSCPSTLAIQFSAKYPHCVPPAMATKEQLEAWRAGRTASLVPEEQARKVTRMRQGSRPAAVPPRRRGKTASTGEDGVVSRSSVPTVAGLPLFDR